LVGNPYLAHLWHSEDSIWLRSDIGVQPATYKFEKSVTRPLRRVSAVSRLQKDGQKQPKPIWKDNFRYLSLAHLLLVTF